MGQFVDLQGSLLFTADDGVTGREMSAIRVVVLSGGVPLEPCNGCVIASLVAPPGDANGYGYLDRCEGCLIGAIGRDGSMIHALDHMSCTLAGAGEAPAIALYRFDLARDTAGIDITLCGTDGMLTAQLILYDARGEELDRSTYCAGDPFCACLEDLPLPAGTYYVAATTPYTMEYGAYALSIACRGAVQEERFRRGDVNADGAMNIADAVALLGSLFAGADAPSCFDAADANDDGAVNIADAIAILAYLFADGPALPAPFAECGVDPTEDALGCDVFPPCGTGT